MKTRSPDGQRGDGLPPPPAPTARDANPWPMSQGAAGQQHEPRHPRAPGWPPRRGSPKPPPAGRKRRTPWIPLLYLLVIALAWLAAAVAQAGALDDFVRLQVGSFTSEAQTKQDARYDAITWHIAEIWPDGDANERWLYTESWMPGAPAPYMQRISRLRQEADGTIGARRCTLPGAMRFVGAWQEPARFATLKPADIAELHGCDAVIARAGAGRFEGSTSGARCRNSYKGASYAISQSVLTADEMVNWDRGFDAGGHLVWGPEAGGYYEAMSPVLEGIAEFEVLVLPVPPIPK